MSEGGPLGPKLVEMVGVFEATSLQVHGCHGECGDVGATDGQQSGRAVGIDGPRPLPHARPVALVQMMEGFDATEERGAGQIGVV
jgi:hypothetical protein